MTLRWGDGPDRAAVYDPPGAEPAWPAEPGDLVAVPPHLPAALHEAGRTAAREPGKYAATRVQLRGAAGEVVGTDGKQALAWGGFVFPFADDLLVPAVPLFGSRELAGESAVSLGRTADWLFLVVGPWRVWLLVDREGRFPDVRAAVPRAAGTRLEVSERDAAAVLAALPGLPCGDLGPAVPVTLDLGPRVAVRARAEGDGPAAEVPLPDSAATGPPVRVALQRAHLGRALALGFREFRAAGPEKPVVARAGDRVYLAAPLDPASAVAPDPPAGAPPRRKAAAPERAAPAPERYGHADPPADPAGPLAEAEALRGLLTEATARAARLVSALKQYRRERRSLRAAWSSLRHLNLEP